MELWSALREEPWGYCKSFNMPPEVATEAARRFVTHLMTQHARARGKQRWAEKTPDNALHIDFLAELFPDARFVHIVRDGLDVAMSTSVVAPHRKGISSFLESRIGFGPEAPDAPNTPLTALLRWRNWNNRIQESLRAAGASSLEVQYEKLVAEPEVVVRQVMAFVDERYEPAMLDYASQKHEFPEWEWGSADVKTRGEITPSAVGRAKRELPPPVFELLAPVVDAAEMPRESRIANQRGEPSDAARTLVRSLNELAGAMGLGTIAESQAGDAAWLWRHAIAGTDWRGRRVITCGGPDHPLAWVTAILGARLTIVSRDAHKPLVELARRLRLDVSFESGMKPDPEGSVILALEPLKSECTRAIGAAAMILVLGDAASWINAWPGMKSESASAAVLVRPASRGFHQGVP